MEKSIDDVTDIKLKRIIVYTLRLSEFLAKKNLTFATNLMKHSDELISDP